MKLFRNPSEQFTASLTTVQISPDAHQGFSQGMKLRMIHMDWGKKKSFYMLCDSTCYVMQAALWMLYKNILRTGLFDNYKVACVG